MKNFAYLKANSLDQAIASLGNNWESTVIKAGGTDLLGTMKNYLVSPEKVVGLSSIKELSGITEKRGKIEIGALTKIADIVSNEHVKRSFPALAKAASKVASPQLRNQGTIGGNLCQRPRCWYFRDKEVDCLKKSGDLCFAASGRNKYHAILGGGPCYIVHPSDTAVALSAYDAELTIKSKSGEKKC